MEARVIAGRRIAVRVLPVETGTLRDRLETALREEQPEYVIGLGYGPGRFSLGLERVAVNILDFTIPDVAGTMRKDDPILRGGPGARLTTLPHRQIVEAWSAVGVPGYVSNTAGTYLCNQWLYEALSLTTNASPPVPVGFIHLPALPAQAAELGAERTPSMTLDLMRKGIETAIETISVWLENRPAAPTARAAAQMWIPRGLREVER